MCQLVLLILQPSPTCSQCVPGIDQCLYLVTALMLKLFLIKGKLIREPQSLVTLCMRLKFIIRCQLLALKVRNPLVNTLKFIADPESLVFVQSNLITHRKMGILICTPFLHTVANLSSVQKQYQYLYSCLASTSKYMCLHAYQSLYMLYVLYVYRCYCLIHFLERIPYPKFCY